MSRILLIHAIPGLYFSFSFGSTKKGPFCSYSSSPVVIVIRPSV